MVDQEDKSITAMIAKMQRKRNELVTELEKVQEWLSQLDTILNRGKVIIGEESTSAAPSPAPLSPENKETETIKSRISESISGRILRLIDKPDAEKTHAEKCKQLLEEAGSPLSLAQLSDQFLKRNWPIKGNNRRLIIYNSMTRRKDWFMSLGNKMWGLKGRDDQQEKLEIA